MQKKNFLMLRRTEQKDTCTDSVPGAYNVAQNLDLPSVMVLLKNSLRTACKAEAKRAFSQLKNLKM